MYQFLPFLKDNSIEYDIVAWNGKLFRGLLLGEIFNYFVMTAKISWALLTIKRYEVVFVQKITLMRLLWLLRALKIKYVYDIDDAIYTLHSAELAKVKQAVRVNAAIQYMKSAKHMIVELPSTEEVARQNCAHVTTILGPIDTHRYHPSPKEGHSVVTIGWIGSLSNTFYLFDIQNGLENLCRKYPNVRVNLIGTRGFITKEKNISLIEWKLDTELHELAKFDIGIMPLTDDEWSRGKGSYKLLQYLALGIPAVASPVGINTTLLKDGETGFLARTKNDWEEKLSVLVENALLREQMGKKARDIAVRNYSLDAASVKFISAIKQAANA